MLGQSFGGFCALHYLSSFTESLRAVVFTGGLPVVGRPVDDVYATTFGVQARLTAAHHARFPGERIPRPPHWSGFRVVPDRVEFWQDMPFRLHDRRVYTRAGEGWTAEALYP